MLGTVLLSLAPDVFCLTSGLIFQKFSSSGLNFVGEIFFAQTASPRWRLLAWSAYCLPSLWSVWIAPRFADFFLEKYNWYEVCWIFDFFLIFWRWAFGIWLGIEPIVVIPLVITLYCLEGEKRPWCTLWKKLCLKSPSLKAFLRKLSTSDWQGWVLFSSGLLLLTVTPAIARFTKASFTHPAIIACIVIGFIFSTGFVIWETLENKGKENFIEVHLLRNRNVAVSCALSMVIAIVGHNFFQKILYLIL